MGTRALNGETSSTRPVRPAPPAPSGPESTLRESTRRALFDSSGRRWFILGVLLLVIMGAAVWTVRHDPLAISALFFAIAAILGTVPKIMVARARILYGHPSRGRPKER